MKTLFIHIVLVTSALVAVCLAVENPNVGTSFQSNNTVPSQGQQQRLLTRPNPLAASGNDVVTGNVGGMRYFHGVVPYGSTYYTGANLRDSGSGDVSDFLRRSVNPVLSDRNPGQSRAFYEPRRAVSSVYVQSGKPTEFAKSVATSAQRNPYTVSTLPSLTSVETQPRPLSNNNFELEQVLSRQVALREAAKEKMLEDKALEAKDKFKDFFEIKPKPEDLQKLQEEPTPEEETQPVKKPEQQVLEEFQKEGQQQLLEPKPAVKDPTKPKDEEKPNEDQAEQPDQAALHAEAEQIRGEHETFADLAGAKFSDYMSVAEEFIRDGKFYKAADAYSLAAVWKSDDARPFAGQAFALFAAGEYMSSAYYLSRAIELDPALAAKKYDLPGLFGDRDIFENRLIEMTDWQQRSRSGELAFLMAYVLYQNGKIDQAANAIAKAQEKMPDSAAVTILKKVIIPEKL